MSPTRLCTGSEEHRWRRKLLKNKTKRLHTYTAPQQPYHAVLHGMAHVHISLLRAAGDAVPRATLRRTPLPSRSLRIDTVDTLIFVCFHSVPPKLLYVYTIGTALSACTLVNQVIEVLNYFVEMTDDEDELRQSRRESGRLSGRQGASDPLEWRRNNKDILVPPTPSPLVKVGSLCPVWDVGG